LVTTRKNVKCSFFLFNLPELSGRLVYRAETNSKKTPRRARRLKNKIKTIT